MKDSGQGGLSPLEYLKIFFRRKWLFFIPAFAGLIIGVCSGILLPPKYLSSTLILVQEGKSDNPLFSNLAVSTTVAQRMNTIRESMLSWNSLVELAKRLHLDRDVKSIYDFEQLILGIRKKIAIRPRSQNIIELHCISEDPIKTQAVVKNITDIFIEKNVSIQNQETSDAIKFIEEQLRVYKGKIMSAEIAALQERLDDLLIDSTEKHPLVKELREQIAAKKAALQKENLEYTESDVLKVETSNPLINEIKKTLDVMQPSVANATTTESLSPETDLYKVMLVDKLDMVMARDVKVNEGIYNMLLQRLETAKITQRLQSSKEGTRYTILDPPRVPIKPVEPNKLLVSFLGLFLGIFAGIGLVIVVEFLDSSFLDVQEAKEYLGEPLLGAISKIRTLDSIREDQERQKWYIGLTLVSGVSVVILAAFIAHFLR